MNKLLTLVSALVLGFASTHLQASHSLDCPEGSTGPYVSVIGGGIYSHQSGSPYKINLKEGAGYIVGGAIGYRFENPYRIEAEVAYFKDGIKSGTTEEIDVSMKRGALTGMINGYLDWRCPGFTPYVGAGVGVVHGDLVAVSSGYSFNDKAVGFGYQLMAGVNVPITESLEAGLEYRYIGTHAHVDQHGLLAKLTHKF